MGGDYEQHVEKPSAVAVVDVDVDAGVKTQQSTDLPSLGEITQGFRIHHKNGEVHFHAKEDSKLKVVMSAAEFWKFWDELKNFRVKQSDFYDPKNQTLLVATIGKDNQNKIDIRISIKKEVRETGGVFDKIAAFASDMGVR